MNECGRQSQLKYLRGWKADCLWLRKKQLISKAQARHIFGLIERAAREIAAEKSFEHASTGSR